MLNINEMPPPRGCSLVRVLRNAILVLAHAIIVRTVDAVR